MAAFPNISLLRKKPAFMGNKDGAVLIEFAFVAPVLILLVVGAIEYGVYFLNSMSSSRALSASTQLVMQDPTDPENQTFANRQLAFGEHKVCAKAFPTLAAAESGTCADGEWAVNAPAGLSDDDYYIAMSASGEAKSISGLFSPLLPAIKHNEVVKVSASSGGGGTSSSTSHTSSSSSTSTSSRISGGLECHTIFANNHANTFKGNANVGSLDSVYIPSPNGSAITKGIKCNESAGYMMTGCVIVSSNDKNKFSNEDNDLMFVKNGCYLDDDEIANLDSHPASAVTARCCRVN